MAKTKRKNFMDKPETLVDQLNDWLKEAENHNSAAMYRRESMEDYQFYAGDQDDDDTAAELAELNRPATVYNEVKPKIDMLVGLIAQMKAIPFPVPSQSADVAFSELMGGVYRHYRNKIQSTQVEQNCGEHMVKGGLSYQHYWIDSSNPFKPRIKTERVPGRDCWRDPISVNYDMSDSRFFFRDKWLEEDYILTRWPDTPLEQVKVVGTTQVDMPAFFDLATEKFRIVECWFKHLDEVHWFVNPLNDKIEWLLPKEFKKLEEALRAGVPLPDGSVFQLDEAQEFENVVGFKSNIYSAMFNDTTLLEFGPTPYNFDSYPYTQYGAYLDEDNNRWFGAIAMMKDPQRNLNTMRRQLTHLLQTAPRGILMHEVGAINDIDDYEERGSDPTYHMMINAGKLDKVKFTDQPQISPIYQYLDGMNSQGMKDTSGIQDSLLGIQTSSREAGITTQMRQEQNIAVLHIVFSNYKESRRLSAIQMLSLIQQYVTEEEVIRIEGREGVELLTINSQVNPQTEGFNDISAMEYDIAVDEDIESTTTRLAMMRMMTDFATTNPGTIPPDVLLEYGNVPKQIVGRVMAYYEQRRADEQEIRLAEINSKNQPKAEA